VRNLERGFKNGVSQNGVSRKSVSTAKNKEVETPHPETIFLKRIS
jgi:hypothetical protein